MAGKTNSFFLHRSLRTMTCWPQLPLECFRINSTFDINIRTHSWEEQVYFIFLCFLHLSSFRNLVVNSFNSVSIIKHSEINQLSGERIYFSTQLQLTIHHCKSLRLLVAPHTQSRAEKNEYIHSNLLSWFLACTWVYFSTQTGQESLTRYWCYPQ